MMIHCKNCKQKFYVMNENSELEGKVIQCKYCNDQSIYESRTVYLENRLEELSKDLDNAEIKINYNKIPKSLFTFLFYIFHCFSCLLFSF